MLSEKVPILGDMSGQRKLVSIWAPSKAREGWIWRPRVQESAGEGNNGEIQEAKRKNEGKNGTKFTGRIDKCRMQWSVKSKEERDGSSPRLVRYGDHPSILHHFPFRPVA